MGFGNGKKNVVQNRNVCNLALKMTIPSKTQMQLLALLSRRYTSGTEVKDAWLKVKKKPISSGTLYTSMRRLREEGWISVVKESNGDNRKVLFYLTKSGAKNLRIAKAAHALKDELKGKV